MKSLVLVEYQQHDATQPAILSADTYAAINAARELKLPIDAVVIGDGVVSIAELMCQCEGVAQVVCLDHPSYRSALPECVAPALAHITQSGEYSHLVTAATGVGKNILPRVAALLDVMQVSEVTKILDHHTFEHLIYAGSAVETLRSQQDVQVLTVRSTHFSKQCESQPAVNMTMLNADEMPSTAGAPLTTLVSIDDSIGDGASDLGSAKVVVAGGGGLRSEEEFHGLLKPLAEALGGALGASRMPVANGYCGSDSLVGQTGKAIAPELYIAVGISGANQHISGMKDSKLVIAINSDEMAPIFKHADYGLVADAKVALPALTQLLSQNS